MLSLHKLSTPCFSRLLSCSSVRDPDEFRTRCCQLVTCVNIFCFRDRRSEDFDIAIAHFNRLVPVDAWEGADLVRTKLPAAVVRFLYWFVAAVH